MSDATGWKHHGPYAIAKTIRGVLYEIEAGATGLDLYHTPHGYRIKIDNYEWITDAKRAAHDHARSKG